MNHKKANLLFLIIIIVHLLAVAALYIIPGMMDAINSVLDIVLGELIIIIPALVFVGIDGIAGKTDIINLLCFNRIRAGSVFMLILYGLLLIPTAAVFNALTMLFTENVVTASFESELELPWYLVILMVGIIGPFCEEFVFRGIIFNGMRKSERVSAAVLMSALAFGLMHMNFNQALYAFVLGLFMALAVVATDSIWASLIVHCTVNLEQSATLYLTEWMMPGVYSNGGIEYTNEQLYLVIAVYLVIALITTTLAVCVIVWVAGHEGHLKEFREAVPLPLEGRKVFAGSHIITVPMIVGIVLCLAYMILIEFWK